MQFLFFKLTAMLVLILTFFFGGGNLISCAHFNFQFPASTDYISCASKHAHRLEDTQKDSMIFYNENGGTRFLRNFDQLVTEYMTSCCRI
jgi:hypothetical protein